VDFQTGFAHPLRRVVASRRPCGSSASPTIVFAIASGGAARMLAVLAAVGMLLVLVGTVAVLVPIQRRLVASGPQSSLADITRW
jgi:hypothetical protein